MIQPERITGVLLAGGQSSRMGGGDKCLRLLNGQPLLWHVIRRATPQVAQMIINANGDKRRFNGYGLSVIPDPVEGYAGPLAGILAGMKWARKNARICTHIASFATDTPFFPESLVSDIAQKMENEGAEIGVAASGGFLHPVFGLWPVSLADDLEAALIDENLRKIRLFLDRYNVSTMRYIDTPHDPFFNINTPEDIKHAETLALSV